MMFWALAFPLILGTLFYISFGNIGVSATGDSDWDPVPVAVIDKLDTKSSGTEKASGQDVVALQQLFTADAIIKSADETNPTSDTMISDSTAPDDANIESDATESTDINSASNANAAFDAGAFSDMENMSAGTFFADFLTAMDGEILDIQEVKDEKDAKKKLENDEILGIYYVKDTPSLTITKNGVNQSILTSLLNTYNQNSYLFKEIAMTHPERLAEAVSSMQTNGSSITEKNVGGKTLDPTVLYFFALIAYACMSGAYLGIEAVHDTQANLSALGARRSITPYRKQLLVFVDMLVLIFIHFINVMILTFYLNKILGINLGDNFPAIFATNFMGALIGICLGLMIGCIGKLTFAAKIGICTATTLLLGFLSGLMFGNMKDVVEQNVPILNRINPAAVLSDAYYCISVYNDTARYQRCMITLLIMSLLFLGIAFLGVRRDRYDSI